MREGVLITGGAKRVGRAVALHLARSGYDIALHYGHSKTEAEETARAVAMEGAKCVLFHADLADAQTLPGVVAAAFEAMPQLCHLVNNAAIFERLPFGEGGCAAALASYTQHMDINLRAPVLLTHAFAEALPGGAKGSVVNMLDTHITRNTHGFFDYLLSKKALAAFTPMAAASLGPHLRVNGVCPGMVLPGDGFDEAYQATLAKRLPLKATATPDDVAEIVRVLIATPSLTGQLLFADGGERVG